VDVRQNPQHISSYTLKSFPALRLKERKKKKREKRERSGDDSLAESFP